MIKAQKLTYFFLTVVLVIAFMLRYSTLIHHTIPSGDEGAFLSISVNIHEGRGFTNNVLWHFYNRNESLPYYEDNRHPLYSLLIAGFLFISQKPFETAQWINFICNLFCIVLIFFIGKRAHSSAAGLLAAFFMALSWPQIKYSSHIYAEALFETIVLVIALLYISSFQKKNMVWLSLLIGIMIGFSYLCRQNGLFLFVAAFVYAWFTNRRAVLWITLGFFSVASWWMIRNYMVFGSPLYNHFNYFLWIDHHRELWYSILNDPPSLSTYLQNHTAADIMHKAFRGMCGFLSELWKFEGIAFPWNKVLIPFFVFFIVKYKKFKNPFWNLLGIYFFLTVFLLVWTASVIWVCRYLLFYYPFYFLAAAIGILEIGKINFKNWRIEPVSVIVILIFIAGNYYPLKFLISGRNGDTCQYNARQQQIAWIKENIPEKAVILTGDLTESQFEIQRNMINYPVLEDIDKVFQFTEKHGVSDFIINKDLLSQAPILQKYWYVQDDKIGEKIPVPCYLEQKYHSDDFIAYSVDKILPIKKRLLYLSPAG